MSFKEFIVDNIAANTFFQPLFFIIEFFIAGISLFICLKARIIGIIFGIFLNRAYGRYREFWSRITGTDLSSSNTKKLVSETFCNILFMVPATFLILFFAGVENYQITIAGSLTIILSLFSGRPYGWWLDRIRKYFNTNPVLDK